MPSDYVTLKYISKDFNIETISVKKKLIPPVGTNVTELTFPSEASVEWFIDGEAERLYTEKDRWESALRLTALSMNNADTIEEWRDIDDKHWIAASVLRTIDATQTGTD